MKPGLPIPGLSLIEAGGSLLRSHAQHQENNIADAATAANVEKMLVQQAEPNQLADYEAEKTKQVLEANRTRRMRMRVGLGIAAVAGITLGYVVHEASVTVQAGANAAGKIGDGIKYAFTPHDVSAVDVQNVIDGYSFPGLVPPVEKAHMHGTIVVHDQGDFLKISLLQANNVGASVCGTEQVSINLGNPGVVSNAIKNSLGVPELNLQVPVGTGGALSAEFVEDPGTAKDFMGPCADPTPDGEVLNPVGAEEQGRVHRWESRNLQATCALPILDNVAVGLINTEHALFAAQASTDLQIEAQAGLSPQQLAKLKYIRSLLPDMKVNVTYVHAVGTGEQGSGIRYEPITNLIMQDVVGLPESPTKADLADKLQIEKDHMSFPTLNETQCLMTATAVKNQSDAQKNYGPSILNPSAPANTSSTLAGGAG